MYPSPFNYHRPESLQAAIGLLSRHGDSAKLIAGGQSLIPMMKMRLGETGELVDIGRLQGLDHIEERGDRLHIGALVTHAEVAASEVAGKIDLLRECGGGIADRQIRNRGTIGGGTCVADPSGDWPTGLRTLAAELVLRGPDGERTVNIADFILDAYTTTIAGNEILTEVKIPLPDSNTKTGYVCFKRAAACFPTASAGVKLSLVDGVCTAVTIVLGCAGDKAVVCADAHEMLIGQDVTSAKLAEAAEMVVAASSPPPDARGSEIFKRAMLKKLVVEAGERALARCRGENVTGGHRYA
jgi:carbon-monoxide dehydrogenase medium subunit